MKYNVWLHGRRGNILVVMLSHFCFILAILVLLSMSCSKSPSEPEPKPEPEPEPEPTDPISLVSKIEWQGVTITDLWGYVDDAAGKEYAFVCRFDPPGLLIVDATDPANPFQVTTVSLPIRAIDVKTWQHYAYVVSGHYTDDGVILDLSDPANPMQVGRMPGAHNLFIDEQGYLYAAQPGVHIYDLNADPTNPSFVVRLGTEGHDVTVVGDMLYDFDGPFRAILYNIADRTNPQFLTSLTAPVITYYHNGWPTDDGHYLFMTDELSSGSSKPDITIWDIENPTERELVAQYGDDNATVHNIIVVGNKAFASYYTAGFRVFDVSDPLNIKVIDTYDTTPKSGEALRGAFGVYPFTTSGHVYVSSTETMFADPQGKGTLYIFAVEGVTTTKY